MFLRNRHIQNEPSINEIIDDFSVDPEAFSDVFCFVKGPEGTEEISKIQEKHVINIWADKEHFVKKKGIIIPLES